VAAGLQRLDQAQLLFRRDAGEDRDVARGFNQLFVGKRGQFLARQN